MQQMLFHQSTIARQHVCFCVCMCPRACGWLAGWLTTVQGEITSLHICGWGPYNAAPLFWRRRMRQRGERVPTELSFHNHLIGSLSTLIPVSTHNCWTGLVWAVPLEWMNELDSLVSVSSLTTHRHSFIWPVHKHGNNKNRIRTKLCTLIQFTRRAPSTPVEITYIYMLCNGGPFTRSSVVVVVVFVDHPHQTTNVRI